MKRLIITVLLSVCLLLSGCGMAGDPISDDLYTKNIYPGTDSTYQIGTDTNRYKDGYFDDLHVAEATLYIGTDTLEQYILGYVGGGSGDMTKAVYDPDDDGDIAESELDLSYATHDGTAQMAKSVYDPDSDGDIAEAQLQLNYATHDGTTQQASHANLTSLSGLAYSSASFVTMTSANTFALDTNTYVKTPETTVTLWDEFASGLLTTGNIGNLGWGFTGTAPTVIATVANHPGIRRIPTTTSSGNISTIWLGGAQNTDLVLYTDYCDLTYIVRMTDVTSDTAFVGAMDSMSTAVGNQDRYGFEYIDSSDTYWMMVTGNGSSSTRTATSVTVAINTWYKLRVVRNGSSVNYYIDGVSVGSVNTTLPDTSLNIGMQIQTNTTVAKYLQVDYFGMTLGVTR